MQSAGKMSPVPASGRRPRLQPHGNAVAVKQEPIVHSPAPLQWTAAVYESVPSLPLPPVASSAPPSGPSQLYEVLARQDSVLSGSAASACGSATSPNGGETAPSTPRRSRLRRLPQSSPFPVKREKMDDTRQRPLEIADEVDVQQPPALLSASPVPSQSAVSSQPQTSAVRRGDEVDCTGEESDEDEDTVLWQLQLLYEEEVDSRSAVISTAPRPSPSAHPLIDFLNAPRLRGPAFTVKGPSAIWSVDLSSLVTARRDGPDLAVEVRDAEGDTEVMSVSSFVRLLVLEEVKEIKAERRRAQRQLKEVDALLMKALDCAIDDKRKGEQDIMEQWKEITRKLFNIQNRRKQKK